MTTKIKASVVGYISNMTAGTINLNDGTSNTPQTGTINFGLSGSGLTLTGGNGNNYVFAGADLYVKTDASGVVHAASFTGTANKANKIVTGGNVGGDLTISNNDSAVSGTPSYILGSTDGLSYGKYSPANFAVSGATNASNLYLSAGSGFGGGYVASATGSSGNTIVARDNSGDIYASTFHGNLSGNASTANYADVAEKYLADKEYEPGTVVVFGGDKEVTLAINVMDMAVAGVVSTAPAYMMNSGLEGGTYIALLGRVPCKVIGPISKGDLLVSSGFHGIATAWLNVTGDSAPLPGSVIGKALEAYDDPVTPGVIEVVVGRV